MNPCQPQMKTYINLCLGTSKGACENVDPIEWWTNNAGIVRAASTKSNLFLVDSSTPLPDTFDVPQIVSDMLYTRVSVAPVERLHSLYRHVFTYTRHRLSAINTVQLQRLYMWLAEPDILRGVLKRAMETELPDFLKSKNTNRGAASLIIQRRTNAAVEQEPANATAGRAQ